MSDEKDQESAFSLAIDEETRAAGYDITHLVRKFLRDAEPEPKMQLTVTTLYTADGTPMPTVIVRFVEPPTEADRAQQEWEELIAQPDMQRGMRRLAKRIREQIAAGQFEEGGFAVG